MKVFILAKRKCAEDLSGEGARLYGGRWNSKGTSMLYTSESRALALVEVLVHSSRSDLIPNLFRLVEITLPDNMEIQEIALADLPNDWFVYPASSEIATIGDDWIRSNSTIALKVPSVIIPNEFNILLNPGHPDFKNMTYTINDFHLDERLGDIN